MLVFRWLLMFVHLAALRALPFGSGGAAGNTSKSGFDRPDEVLRRAPRLLLALALATLVHILLFLVLTAEPGMPRGADAASSQLELRPAVQARIWVEPLAVNPEPAKPVSLTSDAGAAVKQNSPVQQTPVAPEQQVFEQSRLDAEEQQEVREQKRGCLGPEEMARLEQARISGTDATGNGPREEVGFPCVEG